MTISPDLHNLAAEWGKNPAEAFQLLGESLRHAGEQIEPRSDDEQRHLSAGELVQGMVEVLVDRCGLMALPLMQEWGLPSASEIGELTFYLIKRGVLGKQANDSIDDFYELPPLEELIDVYFRQGLDTTLQAAG